MFKKIPVGGLFILATTTCGCGGDEHARLARVERGPLGSLNAVRLAREHLAEQDAARTASAIQDCEEHEKAKYQEGIRHLLADVATTLNSSQEPAFKRTALVDLVARVAASSEPLVALVITDGVETASTSPRFIPAPREGVSLHMWVLPSSPRTRADQSQREDYEQINGYWATWAPWVHVHPPFARGLSAQEFPSRIERLEIFDDRTVSVDPHVRAEFHQQVLESLSDLIEEHRLEQIAICPFGDDSWLVICRGPLHIPKEDLDKCPPRERSASTTATPSRVNLAATHRSSPSLNGDSQR